MTVTTTLSRISYIEDGTTTFFAVPFRFMSAADLVVERVFPDGTVATLNLSGDYNVAGVDDPAGGSITRTAATNGATLAIRRRTPLTQNMLYRVGDDFPAESHERALDRLTLMAQEVSGQLADALVGGLEYSGAGTETLNVKQFGAKGDGVTDDRGAIANAVVAARGKRLYFPKGSYRINADAGSIILEEVCLTGPGVLDGSNAVIDQGANFFIVGTGNSPFKVRRGVTFEGLGFYYPNQPNTATPTVYPVTLDFDFTNGAVQFVFIRNCTAYNSYDFIRMSDVGGNVGHVWIEDNTIFAFNRAISITHNQEVIKITGNTFTFGHWNVASEAGAAAFYRANGISLYVLRSDGLWIGDNLFFGALRGILCAVTGLSQALFVHDNSFDQTRYGFSAVGSGNVLANLVGNGFYTQNTVDPTLQGRSIEINTTGIVTDMLVVDANQFNFSSETHIYVRGVGPNRRDLTLSGNLFRAWGYGKTSSEYGAIDVQDLTNLNLTGDWFDPFFDLWHSSGIVGSANSISCNGCSFVQCLTALHVTTSYLIGSGNASYATRGTVADVASATVKVWGPNMFDLPQDKSPLSISTGLFGNYANDAAAAAAGLPIGASYLNGSALNFRIV